MPDILNRFAKESFQNLVETLSVRFFTNKSYVNTLQHTGSVTVSDLVSLQTITSTNEYIQHYNEIKNTVMETNNEYLGYLEIIWLLTLPDPKQKKYVLCWQFTYLTGNFLRWYISFYCFVLYNLALNYLQMKEWDSAYINVFIDLYGDVLKQKPCTQKLESLSRQNEYFL